MTDTLRVAAPLLLVLFLAVTFVWRSFAVWRLTDVNPNVLSRRDDAEGVVARGFRLTILLLVVAGLLDAAGARTYALLAPVNWLEYPALQVLGAALLLVSLVWTAVAQAQIGSSWRVGIDTRVPTALVAHGLFNCSRKPIFLEMRVSLFGFFLLLPSAVTLLTWVLGEVLIQVQVRLEEAFLLRTHGEAYRAYQQRVHRWL